MNNFRRATTVLGICGLLALSAVAPRQVLAQEAPPDLASSEWQFGFDLFQMLFRQRGLEPESDLRLFLARNPAKCVLVLTGDQGRLSYGFQNDLLRFLDRGGAVLIASDRMSYFTQLCTIYKGSVSVSRQDSYLGYPDCPLITSIEEHRLTLGVKSIVANRSGWIANLSNRHGTWTTIARLPGTFEPIIAALEIDNANGGRLVVTADHSLFINGMLWHGDNALLAVNISNWLCEGDRQHVLFYTDGRTQIATNLDNLPPPEPPPNPELPEEIPDLPAKSLLTFANSFLTGLEDANVLNDMAAGQPKKISDRTYHRALLLFAVAVIGLITLYKLLNKGPSASLPVTRAATPVINQRLRDLKNSDDLRPLTQELASELMQSITGSLHPPDWIIKGQHIELIGKVRHPKHVKRDLERISQIATDVEKFAITSWDFDQLAKKIARLKQLHLQGHLELNDNAQTHE